MVTGYSVKSWQSQIVRTDTQVFFLIVFSFIYFFPWRVPEVYCFCLLFFCLAPSSSSFSQNFFFLSLSRNSHTVAVFNKMLNFLLPSPVCPDSALCPQFPRSSATFLIMASLSKSVLGPASLHHITSTFSLDSFASNFPFFESDLTNSNFSLSSGCSIVSPSSVFLHLDWLLT